MRSPKGLLLLIHQGLGLMSGRRCCPWPLGFGSPGNMLMSGLRSGISCPSTRLFTSSVFIHSLLIACRHSSHTCTCWFIPPFTLGSIHSHFCGVAFHSSRYSAFVHLSTWPLAQSSVISSAFHPLFCQFMCSFAPDSSIHLLIISLFIGF